MLSVSDLRKNVHPSSSHTTNYLYFCNSTLSAAFALLNFTTTMPFGFVSNTVILSTVPNGSQPSNTSDFISILNPGSNCQSPSINNFEPPPTKTYFPTRYSSIQRLPLLHLLRPNSNSVFAVANASIEVS